MASVPKAANKSVADNPVGSSQPSLRLEEARVAELLDIASEVFLANGFASASLNEIAKRSSSSKTTFYARFPNKEKLFIAVIERRLDAVFGEFSSSFPVDADVENTLRDYSSRFLQFAVSRKQIELLRLVSMEAPRFPELGRRFYELGPKRGQMLLAEYLRTQIALRRLIDHDPARMAEHFISLLSGGAVRWEVLGLQSQSLTKAKRQEHIEEALRVFLRAYGRRDN